MKNAFSEHVNLVIGGDNLLVMQELPDESADAFPFDPPFNSKKQYNVQYKNRRERSVTAEAAFTDSWVWTSKTDEAMARFKETRRPLHDHLAMVAATFGRGYMGAYLVMMAERLIEIHRILKPTGSIFVHCDSTANSYIRILLDLIFGPRNFRSEIIWRSHDSHNDRSGYGKQSKTIAIGRQHDVIYWYSKTDAVKRNDVFLPYSAERLADFKHVDGNGLPYELHSLSPPRGNRNPIFEFCGVTKEWPYSRETIVDMFANGEVVLNSKGTPSKKTYIGRGCPLQDLWTDILPAGKNPSERTGYDTQKPVALVKRMLELTTDPGDLVIDPFCGCGTTIVAAQEMGRRWIGIDISEKAIDIQVMRLEAMTPRPIFKVRTIK